MTKLPHYIDKDDNEVELPFRWQICCSCDGHGTSSAYLGAFTRDQLEEEGPEFIEDYFGGAYDRACEACDGSGKVAVVDRKRASKAALACYDAQRRADKEIRAIERQERLFEGGWREEGWFR